MLGEGRTLSGLPAPVWALSAFDAPDLDASPEAMRARLRSPKGPLAQFLSARLGTDDLEDIDGHEEADLPALRRVAAYTVTPLIGAEFEVTSTQEIADAVRALLARTLPGFDWWVPEQWGPLIRKYGFIHKSLPAPPNEATGEPMALELFGKALNAVEWGSPSWSAAQKRWRLSGEQPQDEPSAVLFPARIQISVVTYSNVRYPGYRVPFCA